MHHILNPQAAKCGKQAWLKSPQHGSIDVFSDFINKKKGDIGLNNRGFEHTKSFLKRLALEYAV